MFWKRKENLQTHNPLLGVWYLVRAEGDLDIGREGLTIMFDEKGSLTFTNHEAGKDQIMYLTYVIEGETIITDQPSHPQEERTEFSFDNGQLVLRFGNGKAWFKQAPN